MRIMLHPGHVYSAHDRQRHFISAQQLMTLYRLNADERLSAVVCRGCKGLMFECEDGAKGFEHLRPLYNGDYSR